MEKIADFYVGDLLCSVGIVALAQDNDTLTSSERTITLPVSNIDNSMSRGAQLCYILNWMG